MRREEREPKSARGAAFRVERLLAIGRERIENSPGTVPVTPFDLDA
jgi:hypothetical protein